MAEQQWDVEYTDEFEEWFDGLPEVQQDAVFAVVEELRSEGPAMGRPHCDTIEHSRYKNMKELRVQQDGALRILFIFDPRRTAVLLLGGDKTGLWNEWYPEAIKQAEDIYEQYLAELRKEGLLPPDTPRGAPRRKSKRTRRRDSRRYGMSHHKWEKIQAQIERDPERMARVEQMRQEIHADQQAYAKALAEVRQARALTQKELARKMRLPQSHISRLERRGDLLLSTFDRYMHALGAELEITAVFHDPAGDRRIMLSMHDLLKTPPPPLPEAAREEPETGAPGRRRTRKPTDATA